MKQLKLEVIFGSKNNLSPALKAILSSSNAAAKALKKTKDEIRALNDQQKKIDGYQKQKKAVQDQGKALQDLQNHIKNLRQQMKTNPSADLTRDFDKSVAKAKKLKEEYEKNRIELQRMRTEMNQAGLSTNRLAEHQQRLRTQLNQANQSMLEQEQRLKRMQQMQQNYERTSGRLRSAAMGGMTAAMGGAGALYAMRKPIEESKRVDVEGNRIHALGLGEKTSKQAIKYAQAMDTFGTSIYDNMVLVRDGMTIFSDLHHAEMVAPTLAKMKFGNKAMFGHEKGEENERAFMDMLKVIELRGGLKSEKAFVDQSNKIQQVITATGGRVQGSEWLNAIKTGGIAVKGLSDEALYYKMESIVQEWGGFRYGTAAMSAYQNIYQGRTTKRAANNMLKLGLIDDPSKLKHDKAGQVSFLDVGAIKGADIFKKDQFAWMEQVLLPTLASKGITEKGAVLDAIGSIFTNRTASNLFGDMFLQRDIINKSAKMNAGADNVDQLYDKAKNTAAGQELETKAKLSNAYLRFGQTILPIYVKALDMAANALEKFTGWMEKNPALAKALGTGLIVIATSLLAIGGALFIFSPLILSMLSLRLMMASTATGATVLSRVFAAAPAIMNVFKTGLMTVGRVFIWLGRALLMNPLGLAITAIAAAAYLIYRNWTPIKAFFMDLWSGVKNAFNTGVSFIKSIIQSIDTVFAENPILNLLMPIVGIPRLIIANWSSISAFFGGIWGAITIATSTAVNFVTALVSNGFNTAKNVVLSIWNGIKSIVLSAWQGICNIFSSLPILPYITAAFNAVFSFLSGLYNRMVSLGSNIIQGLIDGIKTGFEKLKGLWGTINSYMPSFMQKKMDIHSPSRVMAGLGGHIMSGIGVGLEDGFPGLKDKFVRVLEVFNPNAAAALQKIDVAPALEKIRTKAPAALAPSAPRQGITVGGDTITLHIHTQPGQSIQELQRMFEQVLNKRDQQKQARIRSSFKDFE